VSIADAFVDLPAQRVRGVDIDVTTTRRAQAVIYASEASFDAGLAADSATTSQRVVVFLHGFSQRPRNYESTLRLLAAQGYLVIAPRTWLFDVAYPWSSIEASAPPDNPDRWPICISPQAKLQSALLIDALRCVAWAQEHAGAARVSLLGHSMGAAISLIAARALGPARVSCVAALAPAVKGTELTEMNRLLNWGGGSVDKFASTFGSIPTLIIQGEDDRVVKLRDTKRLFDAFVTCERFTAIVGLCELMPGSHIGFEDSLLVDVGFLRFLDTLLFKLIDVFVFGVLEGFLESEEQLKTTKHLLSVWLGEAGSDEGANADEMERLMGGRWGNRE